MSARGLSKKQLLELAAGNAESAAGAIRDGKHEKACGRLWDAYCQIVDAEGLTPPVIIGGETARLLRRDLKEGP